jgi:hypothetical protein
MLACLIAVILSVSEGSHGAGRDPSLALADDKQRDDSFLVD